MVRRFALAFVAAATCYSPGLAQTATTTAPSAIYVFGDSLSDRGNLADALGHHFPTPPFYHDSFTNGDVAVQVLAQRFGLSADASLFPTAFQDVHGLGYTPGTNFAVAGATAGNAFGQGVPGLNLLTQVGAFFASSGNTVPTNALLTVFIGGNDVRTAAHQGMTDANGNFVYNPSYITDGITAELTAINALIARGGNNLLVVNVPDVGAIPEFTTYSPAGQAGAATAASIEFNRQLANGIAAIAAGHQSTSIKLFDLYTYANGLATNGANLGITNTTQPCYINYDGVTNTPATFLTINPACGPIDPATGQATNIGQFQYWDPIHPTAKVQAAFGRALGDFVQGVPEPATWAMMVFGFGFIGWGMRRSNREVAAAGLAGKPDQAAKRGVERRSAALGKYAVSA